MRHLESVYTAFSAEEICKSSTCLDEAVYRETYCSRHACDIHGCFEPSMKDRSFCSQHACKELTCARRPLLNGVCREHLCSECSEHSTQIEKLASYRHFMELLLCLNRIKLRVPKDILRIIKAMLGSVSYTHLRAHETGRNLVCRLLLEK